GSDGDRLGVFGHARHLQRGVEVERHVSEAARIAGGKHEDRHGIAVGLRNTSVRVFRARSVLHAEGADQLSTGEPRDRIRHVQPDTLLAYDDGANVGNRGSFQQGVARVSEQDVDSLALENLCDRGSGFHSNALLEDNLRPAPVRAGPSMGWAPAAPNRAGPPGASPSLCLPASGSTATTWTKDLHCAGKDDDACGAPAAAATDLSCCSRRMRPS